MEITALALAGILLFVIAFLFGKDYAECVAALRHEEEIARLRNAACMQNDLVMQATRRRCSNGQERCLCPTCAPTEHQKPGGFSMSFAAILSYGGLVVFILVLVTDFAFLLWDAWQLFSNRPTISDRVWADQSLAVGILGWQLIGMIALAAHLAINPHEVTF